jgi:hypothetical protein
LRACGLDRIYMLAALCQFFIGAPALVVIVGMG